MSIMNVSFYRDICLRRPKNIIVESRTDQSTEQAAATQLRVDFDFFRQGPVPRIFSGDSEQ